MGGSHSATLPSVALLWRCLQQVWEQAILTLWRLAIPFVDPAYEYFVKAETLGFDISNPLLHSRFRNAESQKIALTEH
jgi:hypothetical protein